MVLNIYSDVEESNEFTQKKISMKNSWFVWINSMKSQEKGNVCAAELRCWLADTMKSKFSIFYRLHRHLVLYLNDIDSEIGEPFAWDGQ